MADLIFFTNRDNHGARKKLCRFDSRSKLFYIVFCPTGWFSSGGFCMKAFNSTLNYASALANCLALGSDLAQPMNNLESQTLAIVLSNYTNSTLGSYWIGKLISF